MAFDIGFYGFNSVPTYVHLKAFGIPKTCMAVYIQYWLDNFQIKWPNRILLLNRDMSIWKTQLKNSKSPFWLSTEFQSIFGGNHVHAAAVGNLYLSRLFYKVPVMHPHVYWWLISQVLCFDGGGRVSSVAVVWPPVVSYKPRARAHDKNSPFSSGLQKTRKHLPNYIIFKNWNPHLHHVL